MTGVTGVPSSLGLPPLTLGGAAGPAYSSTYNPNSFSDGAFIVSGSGSLGTSIAGAVAGATNSFSMGSLGNLMPLLLLGGVAWIVLRHRK